MSKPSCYFDHSATTPVDFEVLKAMEPYFSNIFGNASSIHGFGQEAMAAVDNSRRKIADFLGCKPYEVYFTSGATESNNLAILGTVKSGDHIITSKIEHPAVIEPCQEIENRGVEVTYVKVNKKGLVSVKDVMEEIRENTVLISIMYVNNEIGTIQPIAEIGRLVKNLNKSRKQKIYFHTDAVQAVNYCEMKVNDLNVDMLSFSSHKIYGPKGIGVLYKKAGVPVSPIQFGGHQEKNIRPGTLNVPAIVGFGKAVELVLKNKKNAFKIKKIRDRIIKKVLKNIPDTYINGDLERRIPNNAHFSFRGVEGESMLLLLDQQGIAVSTGSACSSGLLQPSHVLMALGIDPLLAHGSLRITLGRESNEKEADFLLSRLPRIIKRLRKISPIK